MTTDSQSGAHKRKNYKDDAEKPVIAKTATDLQRLRLEKLMKQPDKPVPIPERPKEKSMPHVPDFVRNVMGSSAGAGSGEFHVYRHLRRKEYARQKFIQERAEKELRDEEYHMKLEENRRLAEERTAKKRAKRLKKKQKQNKKFKPVTNMVKHSGKDMSSDSESQSENASEESEKSSFAQTEVKTERKRDSDKEKTLCNIEKADILQGESKSSKHKKNEPENNDNESKESSEGSDSEG